MSDEKDSAAGCWWFFVAIVIVCFLLKAVGDDGRDIRDLQRRVTDLEHQCAEPAQKPDVLEWCHP